MKFYLLVKKKEDFCKLNQSITKTHKKIMFMNGKMKTFSKRSEIYTCKFS